jgi:hypothetical protein
MTIVHDASEAILARIKIARYAKDRTPEMREEQARIAREKRARRNRRRVAADHTYIPTPSKAELADRTQRIVDLIGGMEHPVTVRQVFYAATVAGIVPKTDDGPGNGYDIVQRVLSQGRTDGTVKWEWIIDNTRRTILPGMWDSPAEILQAVARQYKRDPFADQDELVSIWLEKDALAGVLESVTMPLGVPLNIMRGFTSKSQAKTACETFEQSDKPMHVYHLGDYDPSGLAATDALENFLKENCANEIHFKRLALTPTQIKQWKLPTRPTKIGGNRHAVNYGGAKSCELDAIPPDKFRALVRSAIMDHIDKDVLAGVKEREDADKARLLKIARTFK